MKLAVMSNVLLLAGLLLLLKYPLHIQCSDYTEQDLKSFAFSTSMFGLLPYLWLIAKPIFVRKQAPEGNTRNIILPMLTSWATVYCVASTFIHQSLGFMCPD